MPPSSDRYRKLFPISWERLHSDCKTLAWKLLKIGPFKGIYAITRGGLFPATILSRELEIRHVDTVCVTSYDWQKQGETGIIKGIDSDGEGWLLLDDLVDTGKTAQIVRDMLPKAHFATVYAKPEGKHLVDTFITEFTQDTWVLFPWDSEIQFVEPMAKTKESEGK